MRKALMPWKNIGYFTYAAGGAIEIPGVWTASVDDGILTILTAPPPAINGAWSATTSSGVLTIFGAPSLVAPIPGSTEAPLSTSYGWNPDFDAGTDFDLVLTESDDVQAAIAANLVNATEFRIGLRGGRYPGNLDVTGSQNLTISRYGSERVKFTGADVLTGWTPCTVVEEGILGANYASVYKTVITIADLEHGSLQNLNIHENGEMRYISQDRPGKMDNIFTKGIVNDKFQVNDDDTFWQTTGYGYEFVLHPTEPENRRLDRIISITDEAVFSRFPSIVLTSPDVRLNVYCETNRVQFTTITDYDPSTFTATIQGGALFTRPYVESKQRFSIVNVTYNMEAGAWATVNNNDGTATVYFRPVDPSNLVDKIEYSTRGTAIRIGTITNLKIQGLEVVQYEAVGGQRSVGIGMIDSASRGAGKSGLTIQHCRMGDCSGGDYGALHINNISNVRLSNLTIENVLGYGMYLNSVNDGQVFDYYAKRCAQTAIRMQACTQILWLRGLIEECSNSTHANKWNATFSSDQQLIMNYIFRRCGGYLTQQGASRINYAFLEIDCGIDPLDSRAIQSQQSPVDGGRGGVNGSGSLIVDTTFNFFNIETLPYTKDLSLSKYALSLSLSEGSNEKAVMKNCITFGGGSPKIYTNSSKPLHDPARMERSHNIYTKLAYWQAASYGWYPEATEIVARPATIIYADIENLDYRHKVGSPAIGAVGASILTEVEMWESWFPGVDLRRDIDGTPFDPEFPPIGPRVNIRHT